MITQQSGKVAEKKALDYLLAKGMTLVLQNYSCRLGEVDLIMRDGLYLVFVEVRSRTNSQYGGGIGSITHAKKQKIMKACNHYLSVKKLHDRHPLRFDVISLDGQSGQITWLADAFGADY